MLARNWIVWPDFGCECPDFYVARICVTWSLFGSVVVGVFQIIFHVKMHANDIFLFFKNNF
jgi:hypothetical protein